MLSVLPDIQKSIYCVINWLCVPGRGSKKKQNKTGTCPKAYYHVIKMYSTYEAPSVIFKFGLKLKFQILLILDDFKPFWTRSYITRVSGNIFKPYATKQTNKQKSYNLVWNSVRRLHSAFSSCSYRYLTILQLQVQINWYYLLANPTTR